MSFKRGNWDPKWFAEGYTGRKQQSQIIKLDLPNSKAHTVFTLPSWLGFKPFDFFWPQNPPLTSQVDSFIFTILLALNCFSASHHCDRNATHLGCADLRLVLVNVILPSSSLQGTCPFFATFQHHMAHSYATWLPYILSPYAHHSLNPLYIYFDKFSLLLDFWSLLSSQVSLPCPVLSHFMAVYIVMIATYVYNSFIVLGTSITLLTPHKFCAYVTDFRGREDTYIQTELTLLHKLMWGPTCPPQI